MAKAIRWMGRSVFESVGNLCFSLGRGISFYAGSQCTGRLYKDGVVEGYHGLEWGVGTDAAGDT